MTYEKVLDAVSEGTRRKIMRQLHRSPRSVGELAAAVPVSQPAVSQHLKVLREAGLVESRREGRRSIYRLRLEGLTPLRRWVESFWEEAMDAYRASFETSGEEEGTR